MSGGVQEMTRSTVQQTGSLQSRAEAALRKLAEVLVEVPGKKAEWVNVKTAARVCGYHPRTILRAIVRGDLAAHKPGGRREWKIRVEDLQVWMSGDQG
jgi:excisionase family DNA binding protein